MHVPAPVVATAAALAAVSIVIAAHKIHHRRILSRLAAARIAFLNTEDAAKWNDQLDVFSRALGIPASQFERYDCYKGEFPSNEALRRGDYLGVLITGSHFSALDKSLLWLPGLFACLRYCATQPHVNVVGCCFGSQAMAVALGGQVGPNPDGAFVFGLEQIELAQPSALHKALGLDPDLPSSFSAQHPSVWLYESHGEQVLELPADAECIGWSGGAKHELWVAGKHRNILCCQAHPEFDSTHLRGRIEPALRAKGRLSAEQLADLDQPDGISTLIDDRVVDSSFGRRLYAAFLSKGRPQKAV